MGDVVLDEDTTIESLRISAHISPRDQARIAELYGDADSARAKCARVISDARAAHEERGDRLARPVRRR